MAKMITNFAIRVAGLVPDTSRQRNFTDSDNESIEMQLYIKLSCQLGIMGLKSDGSPDVVFNPADDVTRAEFGTMLSRIIW
jgi:hypothetical protein